MGGTSRRKERAHQAERCVEIMAGSVPGWAAMGGYRSDAYVAIPSSVNFGPNTEIVETVR